MRKARGTDREKVLELIQAAVVDLLLLAKEQKAFVEEDVAHRGGESEAHLQATSPALLHAHLHASLQHQTTSCCDVPLWWVGVVGGVGVVGVVGGVGCVGVVGGVDVVGCAVVVLLVL